jgi:hypothetical protein
MFMAFLAPKDKRPILAMTFAALLAIGIGIAVASGFF